MTVTDIWFPLERIGKTCELGLKKPTEYCQLKQNNYLILLQLGVVFLEQGKASQALAYLDKALEFDPEHEQALFNSAILLQELGRAELRKIAQERLLKILTKDGGYSI